MNADTLINRWSQLFSTDVTDIRHEGRLYLVTSGTGEGVFAYDAVEFDRALDAAEAAETEQYAAFCDACTPEVDEDLARAVYAATGLQICCGGSCMRVVDFDEDEEDEDEEDEGVDEDECCIACGSPADGSSGHGSSDACWFGCAGGRHGVTRIDGFVTGMGGGCDLASNSRRRVERAQDA